MLCTPIAWSNHADTLGMDSVTAIPLNRNDISSALDAGGRTGDRLMARATTTTAPQMNAAETT